MPHVRRELDVNTENMKWKCVVPYFIASCLLVTFIITLVVPLYCWLYIKEISYRFSWIRNENKSGDFRVTHQAPVNRWSLFSRMVSFVAHILFSGPWHYRCSAFLFFWRTYGRTDTMCENNDHLFCPGLVGQQRINRYFFWLQKNCWTIESAIQLVIFLSATF